MRPCHTANSKDDKPVSARLALQQIKIDIVEQPMEFLNGYFFNNEYNKKKQSWQSLHISFTKLVCFMNNCHFCTNKCGKM